MAAMGRSKPKSESNSTSKHPPFPKPGKSGAPKRHGGVKQNLSQRPNTCDRLWSAHFNDLGAGGGANLFAGGLDGGDGDYVGDVAGGAAAGEIVGWTRQTLQDGA